MPAPGEVPNSGSPSKTWLVTCAALCLAIVAYGVLGEKDSSGDVAYQLGYNLPIAIFIAGGLHLVFRRREPAQAGWVGFLVIYAALVAASFIATNRQRGELKTAAAEIERTVVAATQATSASTPVAPPPVPAAPIAGGDAGKMEAVVKTMMNRMLAQRREYELELEAVGWSTFSTASESARIPRLPRARLCFAKRAILLPSTAPAPMISLCKSGVTLRRQE